MTKRQFRCMLELSLESIKCCSVGFLRDFLEFHCFEKDDFFFLEKEKQWELIISYLKRTRRAKPVPLSFWHASVSYLVFKWE